MTQAKITITRTRRGLGFPDTQRYVKRAALYTSMMQIILHSICITAAL